MDASHIATGTITALLATALVYFSHWPLQPLDLPTASAFCRSAHRRWRRCRQILQIQNRGCHGAARPRGVDHFNEYRARAGARGVK